MHISYIKIHIFIYNLYFGEKQNEFFIKYLFLNIFVSNSDSYNNHISTY